MKPMQPMAPMTPMAEMQQWWPAALGQPSSSGAQNDARYAFFPDKRRLLIEQDGALSTYDTGDHQIGGVSQAQSDRRHLAFTSQNGTVDLDSLTKL